MNTIFLDLKYIPIKEGKPSYNTGALDILFNHELRPCALAMLRRLQDHELWETHEVTVEDFAAFIQYASEKPTTLAFRILPIKP